MKATTSIFCLLLCLSMSATAVGAAEPPELAVSAFSSTFGSGLELRAKLGERLQCRVGLAPSWGGVEGDDTAELSDVDYELDFDPAGAMAVADLYLGKSQFRLTGGLIYLDVELDAVADLDAGGTYAIGDGSYTTEQLGSLTSEITIDTLAPYVGIGWGNPFSGVSRWRFQADLGVAYHDDPEVSLTSSNLDNLPALVDDLAVEARQIGDEVDNWYLVLSVGVSYRF